MIYSCKNLIKGSNYAEEFFVSRGIEDKDNFINPTKNNLLDPFLLDNMAEGVSLLINHLQNNSKILIIIDSDEDGFTSSAMLWLYLKEVFGDIDLEYAIHEGKQHGLEDIIEDIERNPKYQLIIQPDAGSNDEEYHKRLRDLNIDCLVLDHHHADGYSKYAIVINNQLSSNYPNKALSGGGVVYKFLQALDETMNANCADDYLDLAAVALIGDMMELNTLENRYIVNQGLKNIKNNCLQELINRQSFSIKDTDNITPADISFYITPLVNAIVRVGRPSEKRVMFEAFLDGKKMVPKISRNKIVEGQFESLGEQNARNSVNARSRQNRAIEKAIEQVKFSIMKNGLDQNKIILAEIKDSNIDSTLTGLLAMKLTGIYNRPVLLGRLDDYQTTIKGSIRGMNNSVLKDLRQFLLNSNYFDYCEGHPNAAGFGIAKDKVEDFINYSNSELADVDFGEGLYLVDIEVNGEESKRLEDIIFSLGGFGNIWGKGIEEPLIAIEDLRLTDKNYSVCGAKNNTLRIQKDGVTYIQFNAEKIIQELEGKKDFSMTIVGTPNINNWMGQENAQVIIKDCEIRNTIFDF